MLPPCGLLLSAEIVTVFCPWFKSGLRSRELGLRNRRSRVTFARKCTPETIQTARSRDLIGGVSMDATLPRWTLMLDGVEWTSPSQDWDDAIRRLTTKDLGVLLAARSG